MNILVTGSAGRIGRYVVRDLQDAGHRVLSVDIVRPPNAGRTLQVDLTQAGEIYGALAAAEAEAVIHLGAWANAGMVPDTRTYGENVRGTFNLFQACVEMGVKRIISASTNQIYGFAAAPPLYAPVDEEHPLRPVNCYALSKMAGEQAADYFVANYDVTIASFRFMGVRPPAQMGPEIDEMAQDPAHGSWLLWTRTDARDAARACRLAVEAADLPSGPYNITGSQVLEQPQQALVDSYFGTRTEIRCGRGIRARYVQLLRHAHGDSGGAGCPPVAAQLCPGRGTFWLPAPVRVERISALFRNRTVNLHAVWRELEQWSAHPTLDAPTNLLLRQQALDFVRYVTEIGRHGPPSAELKRLQEQALALRQRLDAVNARLFADLRERLKCGKTAPAEWRALLDAYTEYRPGGTEPPLHMGYDGLDLLINGVLGIESIPPPQRTPEPEMVHYEPSPARVALDLVDRVTLGPADRFCDIGAGLGQVGFLVHTLSGVPTRCLEFDPGYCQQMRRCFREVGVDAIAVEEGDARTASYAKETVFYLFTPFTGGMVRNVLDQLRRRADTGAPCTVCTYGTITQTVQHEAWLRNVDPERVHNYTLAVFTTQ